VVASRRVAGAAEPGAVPPGGPLTAFSGFGWLLLMGAAAWARRLVAGRPRHPCRRAGIGRHRHFGHLLAAHRTGLGRQVGGVLLGRDFGLREIDLGSHLGPYVVAADDRFEQVEDAAHVLLFDLLLVLQLLRIGTGVLGIGGCRQQLAAVVDDADAGRVHFGHARRHQMHDPCNLRPVEPTPRIEGHQDRSRRALLLAEKTVLVGQRQMHTRILHGGNRQDGTRELAFEPPLEVELLLKLGDAQAVALHEFETRDRALGQALRSQAQTHVVDTVGRHHDGRTALRVFIGHVHLAELGNDGTAVFFAQIGVEHFPVGLAAEHHGGDEQGQQDHHPGRQLDHLALAQSGQARLPARAWRHGSGQRR